MCLAIPGKIVQIESVDGCMRAGKVNFGGILREVNLSCVPEAVPGDYVIVHVGMALSKIDEAEAQEVFRYLERIGELQELAEATS